MHSVPRVVPALFALAAVAVSCSNGQNRLTRLYGPYSTVAVVDRGSNAIGFWNTTDNGDVAPIRTIAGAATGIDAPYGIGFNDLAGEVYVGNTGANQILMFDATGEGDIAPLAVIGGDQTGLDAPTQIAYNSNSGQLITINENSDLGPSQILFFPELLPDGSDGNIPADSAIYGEHAGLQGGDGVTIDYLHQELFVVDGTSASIRVFRLGDADNSYPVRIITGADTLISYADRLAIDYDHDEIFVTDQINGLLEFGRGDSGNVAPRRHIPYDGVTGLQKITGVAYDHSAEEIYVADSTAGAISVFGRLYDGSIAPLRRIAGVATGLDEPVDLVLIP